MKKLLSLALALLMMLGATSAVAADFNVWLITMDLMDLHWVSVDEGCRDAVAELAEEGLVINYKWDAPQVGKDDSAQIECMNNAFADGVNLVLLASNGPDTQVATIQELSEAGVQFIYVDSPANFPALATLATNNTNAGETAGQQMLAALTAAGVTEGAIGIVNVNAATTSTQQREDGFRKAFEGTAFELLEVQYGNGNATESQNIAANYITQGVVGIFGTNEGGTVGVGNAIMEAGDSGVVGVGFDKSDAILGLVRDGWLLCTMAQDPYLMGYAGMMSAALVLTGEELEEVSIDTGVQVIDAAAL
ncbi:MAG: substrate-binding domain-containing protein [Clostridia bacterium]|nr:substrate-binding domain-containing protein [Clostridia bacterium]